MSEQTWLILLGMYSAGVSAVVVTLWKAYRAEVRARMKDHVEHYQFLTRMEKKGEPKE